MTTDTISKPYSDELQLTSPSWQHGDVELLCVEKWHETHDVISFRFQGAQPVKFQFKPGQFLTFKTEIDGQLTYRSYTISSSPSRPYSIVVTIKRIEGGVVSNHLADSLNVGDTITATGPDGVFNLVDIKADKFLFLSAGSGITPMYSMSRWLTDTQVGADIAFLHCAKSPEDLIFKSDLERINHNNPAFKLSLILESGAELIESRLACESGRINADNLKSLVEDFHQRTIFVCGPEPFMKGVKSLLEEIGFDMSMYHQESFGGVAVTSEMDNGTDLGAVTEQTAFMLSIGERRRSMSQEQSLLEGIEAEGLPIIAACRSGVCGACKCQVLEGETESSSQMTLTADEIAQGYVLACSTKMKSDISLAL